MVRLRAKADSPDASEQRFLCPESSTPKAIGSYLFLHTSYRAYLHHMRLFDLYLSREASAMHRSKKIYTSKKADSLLISIKTSSQDFFTTNSKTPILYENASSVHFSSAKTRPLGRRTAGNMSAIQQLCGSSSILLRKIVV
jgi:hypothetical protein